MAYDSKTGNLTRRVDAPGFDPAYAHNAGRFGRGTWTSRAYNEILTGRVAENYDSLRTDMIRCKNVKDFNIYNWSYGSLGKCTTVSAADSDQTIKQESYSAHAQDALYLTDKRIAVADCATSITPSTRAKAVRLTSTSTAATTSGRRSWAWYTSSRRQSPQLAKLFPDVYAAVVHCEPHRRPAAGNVERAKQALNSTCSTALPPTSRCLISTRQRAVQRERR